VCVYMTGRTGEPCKTCSCMKRLNQLFLLAPYITKHNQTMGSTDTRSSDDGKSVDEDEQEAEGDRLVTYYTVLQVKESARPEQGMQTNRLELTQSVRKAYLRLALLYHPDRSGDSEALTFRTIKGRINRWRTLTSRCL
jgi:hypothetical protein